MRFGTMRGVQQAQIKVTDPTQDYADAAKHHRAEREYRYPGDDGGRGDDDRNQTGCGRVFKRMVSGQPLISLRFRILRPRESTCIRTPRRDRLRR